ncbi:head-tail connector protein [Schaalia sp. lx-100]|uniref:head-tail connector protein n=1 Tax=Schaalia sp. lx-100 TaxID=2899081 RepID=UPI001E414D79|nr:head-tail connector protein [Schaalia sp. lx-100]MCD4556976.1 head-tail connector protein [Schaalia sp. lx-100]
MSTGDLTALVKTNLLIDFDTDDELIAHLVDAATSYAASFQHLPDGYYATHAMSPATTQGVVMLATHLYEARDGATGGFWADKTDAARAAWEAIHRLLVMDREWKV